MDKENQNDYQMLLEMFLKKHTKEELKLAGILSEDEKTICPCPPVQKIVPTD